MPPIVTTSSRKITKRHSPILFVILILVLASATYWILHKGKSGTKVPENISGAVASDATPPCDFPASSNALSSTEKACLDNSNGSHEAIKDLSVSSTPSKKTSDVPASTPVIPPRKEKKPTGFNGGAMEQVLGMMVSASDSSSLPPVPMGTEESMLKELMIAATNDIIVYEDDDEKTVKFKEQVAAFKNQLIDLVEQGGSITNAIKEYQAWIAENQQIRKEVANEYQRLKEEASQEEADAFLVEANKELEDEGIPTVNLGKERRRNRPPKAD